MKNQTRNKPTVGKFSLLRQICNFIPPHLAPKLARETGVEKQWRDFSPWSHVVSLLYAQLTHSLGLNDVCDALRLHSGPLSAFGHWPRTNTTAQIIAELEGLRRASWCGAVFFVDDNFIGNKRALKEELLPALIQWQQGRRSNRPNRC